MRAPLCQFQAYSSLLVAYSVAFSKAVGTVGAMTKRSTQVFGDRHGQAKRIPSHPSLSFFGLSAPNFTPADPALAEKQLRPVRR